MIYFLLYPVFTRNTYIRTYTRGILFCFPKTALLRDIACQKSCVGETAHKGTSGHRETTRRHRRLKVAASKHPSVQNARLRVFPFFEARLCSAVLRFCVSTT